MDFSVTSSLTIVGRIKLSIEFRYVECRLYIVMLSVVMVNVVTRGVIMLGVVILTVLAPLYLPAYMMCNYLTIDRS
jgi:hypothetical protein